MHGLWISIFLCSVLYLRTINADGKCTATYGKYNKWKTLKWKIMYKNTWEPIACQNLCYESDDCNYWTIYGMTKREYYKDGNDWRRRRRSVGRRLRRGTPDVNNYYFFCKFMKYGGEDKMEDVNSGSQYNAAYGSKYCDSENPIPEPVDGDCYDDKTSDHDGNRLLGYKIAQNNDMTVSECRTLCKDESYKYAGVESEDQCFCGNVWPDWARKLDKSKCDDECKGEDSDIVCAKCDIPKCGGSWKINVWNSGYTAKDDSERSVSNELHELMKLADSAKEILASETG